MIRGREEALSQFLGIDRPESEYPQSFTIPELIYQSALDALSSTIMDGRERSLHFRYRHNQWRGGIAVRGSRTSTNFLHTQSVLFLPPHIHIHTHPDITEEELSATVENSNITGLNSEAEVENVLRQVLQLAHEVPSSNDVSRTLHEPGGSVGHLLLSSYGNFAWVHKDIKATRGLLQNPFSPKYRRKISFANTKSVYVDNRDAAIFSDVSVKDEVHQQLLQTRASALESAYVCYVSDEPEKATLTKVSS
jgi:hypothetical protein